MHNFPSITSCTYSINLFFVDPADLLVGTGEQEELIEIYTDETAKIKHKECSCSINFWLSIESSYPNHAAPQLLIFPSTSECKQGFLAFNEHKIKNPEPPCCTWG